LSKEKVIALLYDKDLPQQKAKQETVPDEI
jgi:hypothetical protein